MLQHFAQQVKERKLWTATERLLLAISGGVDSVVLAHLLKNNGNRFDLVHCNFKLRGKESDEDERFCVRLAAKLNVRIHISSFDVKARITLTGESIQMAARELRYEYFSRLMKQERYDKLLTAHHANDNIETLVMNLLRGTGIKGMTGIPENQQGIVRPLLNFTREEIENYAEKHHIQFRTDSSNESQKYERNYIRRKIIPAMKEINPSLERVFTLNIDHFRKESAIVDHYVEQRLGLLVKKLKDRLVIRKPELRRESFQETILFHFLKPHGYHESQVKDILSAMDIPGKQFPSGDMVLFVERDSLILSRKHLQGLDSFTLSNLKGLMALNSMKVTRLKEFKKPLPHELVVEEDRLVYPLVIRGWIKGDKFRPFGMKGFKLVSDFFKDIKLDNTDKKNIRLLVNGNGDILWVIGYRSDDRYRVGQKHGELLKLEWIEKG